MKFQNSTVSKFQNFKCRISEIQISTISQFHMSKFKISKFEVANVRITRLILEYQRKRKVATNTIPYERYGEILFQKVASGHLLHFVQDGSSKNALYCFSQKYRKSKAGKNHCIPESCVMLFTTLCTGWMLKKRSRKLVFLQKY